MGIEGDSKWGGWGQAPSRASETLQYWSRCIWLQLREMPVGFFSSLSPKPSVMLNPRRVNLQPAVASRSLSTKEGNKAVGEGGSWTWWVERGGVDAQYRQKPLSDSREPGGDGNYGAVPTILQPWTQFYFGVAQAEGPKPAQMLCRRRMNSRLVGAVTSDFGRIDRDLQQEKIRPFPGKRRKRWSRIIHKSYRCSQADTEQFWGSRAKIT